MVYLYFMMGLFAFGNAEPVKVTNEAAPLDAPWTIEFTEDLSIGPDSGEDHVIWAGATVAVDVNEAGHIFVTDPQSDRIVEFDPKGNLVNIHGGKGEGPGQFNGLTSFQFLGDQSAVALDSTTGASRFHYFDKNMEFKKIVLNDGNQRILKSARFAPSGQYFAGLFVSVMNPERKIAQQVGILNKDREIIQLLSKDIQNKFDPSRARDPNYWSEVIADHLKDGVTGMGRVAFLPDSSYYTATTDRYEITYWSPDHQKQRVFSRNYKPISQSDEEIMASVETLRDQILAAIPPQMREIVSESVVVKAVELAEVKYRKHPIFSLVTMEDGTLLVVHDYSFINHHNKADIFTKEGKFRGSCTLPRTGGNVFYTETQRIVFKNGYCYAITNNQDGELKLVRYNYTVHKGKARG